MVVGAAREPFISSGQQPERWRLHRAGIVNVYQYEDEVLHFGGGRLLLRGVNGSGKSTAMNMLLPFLVTGRQRGIDAAGEQVGILKAWMLDGRDDPQPVGYLWIEFERRGEHLACGCGIKANRASDTVSTWFFVTAKRPGFDFGLVGKGSIPLTADGLRAVLGDGEVYTRRRDYQSEIEHRLFDGASIDQHIGLLHLVRDPRVGDRIDVELPKRLVDALPQLSEQALVEAAQPLDDLEDYRRNVAAVQRTVAAIDGLLAVYRAYCVADLRRRASEGGDCLDALRRRDRDEKAKLRSAEIAKSEVVQLEEQIDRLNRDIKRLGSEISALEESPAYKSGQQLAALESHVHDLDRQRAKAEQRVRVCEQRTADEGDQVKAAQGQCRGDLDQLNNALADAARLGQRCGLACRPPDPARISEAALDGLDACEPGEQFDAAALNRSIGDAQGALSRRRGDLAEVEDRLQRLDLAVERQHHAETALEAADAAAQSAADCLLERTEALALAQRELGEHIQRWASRISPLLQAAQVESSAVDALAISEEAAAASGYEDRRAELLTAADALVAVRADAAAAVKHWLAEQRGAVEEAQAVADLLAARVEPDPPRLGWQTGGDHCLADVIDFAPDLDDVRRAGLEAALEASGLLAARLIESGGAELATGELVAIAAGGVPRSLSDLLTVTIPDRLIGAVDAGLVAKLLDSVSCDASAGAATAAGTDGSFRVGALKGRHSKERAELIGATARREALERDRRAAAEALEQARAVAADTEAELVAHTESLEQAHQIRAELPGTAKIDETTGALDAAAAVDADARAARRDAAQRANKAEQESSTASDELQRMAVSLSLPRDRRGFESVRVELGELEATLERCRSGVSATARSAEIWSSAAGRWRSAKQDRRDEIADLAAIKDEHGRQKQRLETIRRNIGEEYQKVVAERDRRRAENEAAQIRLPEVRSDRDAAFERRAQAKADADHASERRAEALQECDRKRQSLAEAVATPGLIEAVASPDRSSAVEPIVSAQSGAEGLAELLGGIEQLLASAPADSAPAGDGAADINSVHQSLRQRRDTLGAGWDAETLHPDTSLPLVVEVAGPAGRAPLAEAARRASAEHRQLAGLLDQKQADALRELLQGVIATEIAEKMHSAEGFVDLMNERLASVTTAHEVGVRLRWRLSPELDALTARMVELLAKRPDLRLEDDQHELRNLLSERLDEARTLEPDAPYRQLIAEALDYKQWHEMAVMVRRGDGRETRLTRRTPLSEGEKKIVTYLSLFAAVAASHDALAAQHTSYEQGRAGIARFVLLDDAFAKVSEDNHAALFGLIVDLDLDLIATSERLWGTHATVPQLAITEVVRDADLKTILLEHYHWDGATLSPRGTS